MTSDQQDSELNNSVQKTGTGLNPNADAFYYSKAIAPVEKGWQSGEDFLTNGDLKQDDAGGGFSSGDSPVSDSPPALAVDPTLDTGVPPPEFVPDPMVGAPAVIPMVMGAEAAPSIAEEGAVGGEPSVDMAVPPVDLVPSPAVVGPDGIVPNGYGPAAVAQEVDEGGGAPVAQAPEAPSLPTSSSELRSQLLAQLEYYFSRVNLVQDHYLQSQMDGDQYVPITTIASFNQVVRLTRDFNLIVDVLRSSKLVQVDETGMKVRPKHNRSVLMLREIPESTSKADVEAIFNSLECPKLVNCEFAHNGYWYITFNTDEEASDAYLYLHKNQVTFHGKQVLARIKAKPLVRAGGSAQFAPSSNPSRQPQDSTMPYGMRRQQAQFPMMPMSQFQQQVQQAVPPFQLYNFQPTMMPQWGPHNTAAPTFLDPGALPVPVRAVFEQKKMLAMNGYQATSIKPSTNHNRNLYPLRSNRGVPKTHHRPQSMSTDKMPDSRPGDRPHASSMSSARVSPRSSGQHGSESHVQPPPFARSRSEGSAGNSNGHFSNQIHSSVSATPAPLVPEESFSHHASAQSAASSRPDSMASSAQPKRGGNYRRSRRNDEGAKNSRSNPTHGGKEGKPHEPHFELEATSFPPLPGSVNNSSSNDAPEGNKLSDVVKGTARLHGHSRVEEKSKATGAPSTLVTAVPASTTPAVAASATPALVAESSSSVPSAAPVVSATTAAVVSAVAAAPVAAKEPEVLATSVSASANHPLSSSATAAESSATHPSKTSKISGPPAAATETVVSAKQVTASSTPAKQTSTPSPSFSLAATPAPADVPPARLSYAQMVARKQQAENAAKQSAATLEDGPASPVATAAAAGGVSAATTTATARPATHTTLREQSQTQASVSASAPPPKSSSASARPPAKEPPRKDFEPKEQRFQGGGRRAKENRDSRPHRYDHRRRSDRDVKVLPTK